MQKGALLTFCRYIALSDENNDFEIFYINDLLCLGREHCSLNARPGSEDCRPEDQLNKNDPEDNIECKIETLQKSAGDLLAELVQIADHIPAVRNKVITVLSRIRNDFGETTKKLIDNN